MNIFFLLSLISSFWRGEKKWISFLFHSKVLHKTVVVKKQFLDTDFSLSEDGVKICLLVVTGKHCNRGHQVLFLGLIQRLFYSSFYILTLSRSDSRMASEPGSSHFWGQSPDHQTVQLVGTSKFGCIQGIFRKLKTKQKTQHTTKKPHKTYKPHKSFKENNSPSQSDILPIMFAFSTKCPQQGTVRIHSS